MQATHEKRTCVLRDAICAQAQLGGCGLDWSIAKGWSSVFISRSTAVVTVGPSKVIVGTFLCSGTNVRRCVRPGLNPHKLR